jgi:hypothetical protein
MLTGMFYPTRGAGICASALLCCDSSSTPLLPDANPNCHEKSNPEVCAMSHTGFAAPEESSGWNSIQAEVVPVTAFEPPAPLTNAVPRPAPVWLPPPLKRR